MRFRFIKRKEAPRGAAADHVWYDRVYSAKPKAYMCHYSLSPYYFLWTVIADRLRGAGSVLDVGCGTGQLAELLRDQGLVRYTGFDFSASAIALAKERVPGVTFLVDDALTSTLYQSVPYDVVLFTEVLEHLSDDLAAICRVRPGARVLATVPDFDWPGHARHFASAEEVMRRYELLLSELSVAAYVRDGGRVRFFLVDGWRSRATLPANCSAVESAEPD